MLQVYAQSCISIQPPVHRWTALRASDCALCSGLRGEGSVLPRKTVRTTIHTSRRASLASTGSVHRDRQRLPARNAADHEPSPDPSADFQPCASRGGRVFSSADAAVRGIDRHALSRLCDRGDLLRLSRGWFAVGGPEPPSRERRHRLTALALGRHFRSRAAISHHSLLICRELATYRAGLSTVHLTLRRRRLIERRRSWWSSQRERTPGGAGDPSVGIQGAAAGEQDG